MTQETKLLIGVGIVTIVLVVGAALLLGDKSKPQDTQKVSDTQRLVRTDSASTATGSAKVTLVEFGDYQCPGCGAEYPIVKQVMQDNKGKVNFVFRNFPLTTLHKNAMIAALTAEAVGEQGKFWEMHDTLYEHQKDWSDSNDPVSLYLQYAKKLNIDTDKLKEAIDKKTFEKKITRDQDDGIALGVNGTPTFFINGELLNLPGLPTYADFKDKIDALTKK